MDDELKRQLKEKGYSDEEISRMSEATQESVRDFWLKLPEQDDDL